MVNAAPEQPRRTQECCTPCLPEHGWDARHARWGLNMKKPTNVKAAANFALIFPLYLLKRFHQLIFF
jgi:hypothetical protein